MKSKFLLLTVLCGIASVFGYSMYATGQPVVAQQEIALAPTSTWIYGPAGGPIDVISKYLKAKWATP